MVNNSRTKQKPLRILHITFDMRIGGTEQVIKNLVLHLHKKPDEHSILCIESPVGPFGEILQSEGITIDSLSRREGFDITLISQIRRHIKKQKIDILHCHQYTPWVYGTLASAMTGTKVILTEHGRFFPDSTTWKRRVINPILTTLTSKVTAISKATKNALIEFEFIPEKRIQVVYNGIAPEHPDTIAAQQIKSDLKIPSNALVLGTVARLDPIKNHRLMLQSFSRLLKEHPNSYLVIVGDGEERENIEQTIKRLEIEQNVILTGYIKRPMNHLNAMDIFLLPSLSEGTSMTLLEAMSLGKPCVVTDAGGNPEIVSDRVNGIVTPNDDEPAFTKALKEIAANPELINSMGKHSKEIFNQHFTVSEMANHYQHLYTSMRI